MKRLKDFVEIDKRFQNSINLQLDLQDDTKLESYIPTKSSLLILQKYLKSVMGQEKENHIYCWSCCRFFLHRKMKR